MRFIRWVVMVAGVAVIAGLIVLGFSERARFVAGGGLVNLGFRMQDPLEAFDLEDEHAHEITPAQIWDELRGQNDLAAGVRRQFPRTPRHPLVAMVACMDGRLDTQELVGDTRKYYYVIRTAGSVLGPAEEDMIELAVANGVKVVVLTRHSDCAAEKTAADPVKSAQFPALSAAVAAREQRIAALLARPLIAERIAKGELLVKRMNVDTGTEEMWPAPSPVTDAPPTTPPAVAATPAAEGAHAH